MHAADNRNRNFISKFWSAKIDITEQVDSVCRKIKDIYGDKNKFDIAFVTVDDGDPPEQLEVSDFCLLSSLIL